MFKNLQILFELVKIDHDTEDLHIHHEHNTQLLHINPNHSGKILSQLNEMRK